MDKQTVSLEDAKVMQVYWAGEQVRWIDTIANHLIEIKNKLDVGDEREFAYHIYILCSIAIPYDADCVVDFESDDTDPECSRFRMQITMGLKRWHEFRWGATSFIQETIRQVAMTADPADDKVGGFQLKQFKDHISVQDGGGILIKKK